MIFSDLGKQVQSFDWHDLGDIDSIGEWPSVVKLLVATALFVACSGAGFYFDIRSLQAELGRWRSAEHELRRDFERKAQMAANLEQYKEQLVKMQGAFAELLQQLPSQTEVPDLVDDITETGLGSSLAFSRIELGAERAEAFYIEQPILIEVLGAYHDFATFVSGVASLPRIVTLHDFVISPINDRSTLQMRITAKTYRYRTRESHDAEHSP